MLVERPSRTSVWPAYAAAAWAVAFGLLSFYWGAGGRLGAGTLAELIQQKIATRDDGFMLVVWVTGALKVLLALLPLALARNWLGGAPRRLLRVGTLAIGVAISLYGAMGVVNGALTLVGVFDPVDRNGVLWYLFLWGPVWLIGGLLILATVRRTR